MPDIEAILRPLADIAAEALRQNPIFLDEAIGEYEAGRIINEAVASLRSKRTRGGGPDFIKQGSKVSYTRRWCLEYLAARRRTSTSDTGKAA